MKTSIKSLLLAIVSVFAISCGNKKDDQDFGKKATTETIKPNNSAFPLAEKGKEIFEGKGICITCHKVDVKLVGPSLQEIAKIYKEKNASIAKFINEEGEAIIDPTQYEVMKTNFALTKTFTAEERESLEQYVLSQGK
jgi:cytochrome c